MVLSVDCRWGAWGTWTECTKTCGGGTRQGVRKIEREAKNGGVPCTGSTKRTVACNTQSCPGNKWDHLSKFFEFFGYRLYLYIKTISYFQLTANGVSLENGADVPKLVAREFKQGQEK